MHAVLVSEPERETRDFLVRSLLDDGFDVLGARRDGEALELAERERPDLVLTAGVGLCRRLREGEPGRTWDRDVPVIVVTRARAGGLARVRALEGGADDVVERPVVYAELRARIHALLRRTAAGVADVREAGALVIDRRARLVRVRGVPVRLSTKEFELAWMLASEPERVFTKGELLREVWNLHRDIHTRTVDSHASRLRRKLAEVAGDPFVVNVWGVGYRLVE